MSLRRHAHRLALVFVAALCGPALGGEMPPPDTVFSGVVHDTLYALGGEGRELIAVGDFGMVVHSDDGGDTWQRQGEPPTDVALLAVTRKAGHCIASGQQGVIVYAADCQHWQRAEVPTDARLLAVDVNAVGTGYAVGGFGTVLQTRDWGKTWTALTLDWEALTGDWAEPHLYDVHVDARGEVTLVGEFELVIRSRDGGANWQTLHKGRRSLFGLAMTDDGRLYAVGQEGVILRSTDDGASWTELPSGTAAILTSVWARPGGRVVAAGIYTILYSNNGGNSWRADTSAPARIGWHLAVTGFQRENDARRVLVVGSGGTILSIQR